MWGQIISKYVEFNIDRVMKDDLNEVTIHQLKQAVDATISELKPDEDYYLLYLDANNLYGLSQIQKLPLKNFRWVGNL